MDNMRGYLSNEQDKEIFHKVMWIIEIYHLYKKIKEESDEEFDNYFKEHYSKLIEIIKRSLDIKEDVREYPTLILNDPSALTPSSGKVLNYIINYVSLKSKFKQYDIKAQDLFEKIKRIIEDWEENKKTAEETIIELNEYINKLKKLKKRRESTKDLLVTYVSELFDTYNIKNPKQFAKEVIEELRSKRLLINEWYLRKTLRKEVARSLRIKLLKTLKDVIPKERLIEEVNKLNEEVLKILLTYEEDKAREIR